MKRGQIFVRAKDKNGKWYNADVLDLDQLSFKAFVMDRLFKLGMVTGIKDEFIIAGDIEYQSTVKKPEGE